MSQATLGDIVSGQLVRVTLPARSDSKFAESVGPLFRVIDGVKDSLPPREFRKIAGFSRHKFLARVISNDTTAREITLSIEDSHSKNRTSVKYEVTFPYDGLLKLSQLVKQARTFDSDEDEQAFRRKNRVNPINKIYIDPKDQFQGVALIAIVVPTSMVINFTYQVPATGTLFLVTLPESGAID